MRDRDLVDLIEWKEFQYYKATHPPVLSDYKNRSPEDLARDVTVAHDFIKKLVAEKDVLRAHVILAERRLAKWKKWMTAAFAATWTAIAIVLKVLIPYAIRGMLGK